MTEDDDRLLTLIGIGLVLFVVIGLVIGVLAAVNAPSQRAPDPPETDWTIERVNASYVRITHDGGEPVSAEKLIVVVGGIERSPSWSGELTDGDAGVFEATSGEQVALYWDGGRADRVLLESWQV